MGTLLTILGIICLVVIGVVLIVCFVFVTHYLMWFHCKLCKYCNHTMEYKGLKEDGCNGHYLFHCPKCGAWEEIAKEDFFRDVDKGFNPNENVL